MTPRSLFNIILKILGIFFIKDIVTSIPDLISVAIAIIGNSAGYSSMWLLGFSVLKLGVFVYVSYFLIFNTHKLIDLFRLDKGFDEDLFAFSLEKTSIYKIAIIVCGAYMVVSEIPQLFVYVYYVFEGEAIRFTGSKVSYSDLVVSIIKILIGLLLVGERQRITSFLVRKEQQTEDPEPE
ncbi:MAG: hypothetical protein ABIX01_17345 [Chitinophagaceae bacterium]